MNGYDRLLAGSISTTIAVERAVGEMQAAPVALMIGRLLARLRADRSAASMLEPSAVKAA